MGVLAQASTKTQTTQHARTSLDCSGLKMNELGNKDVY
ncbi:hypothetical protein CA13_51900 [Planctomycetes bacterium CA13]|uniref:Uncharacterized protein n=1 Tax=Novipirellula herctigrandis TaxID=2527986 RepID=A0A5C5ZAZ5_9BACT|nr:hypothetical protein CA13_51900 [Planctomycetes bacterium CA13]